MTSLKKAVLLPVDKPDKPTVEMNARPGSSLVKCVQMSCKVALGQTDPNGYER